MRAYLSNSAATFNCGRKAFEEDKNKDFKNNKKKELWFVVQIKG